MVLEKIRELYNSIGSHSNEDYSEWTRVPETPDPDDIGVEERNDWKECESGSGGTLFYPEEISYAGAGEFIEVENDLLIDLTEDDEWI